MEGATSAVKKPFCRGRWKGFFGLKDHENLSERTYNRCSINSSVKGRPQRDGFPPVR